MENKALIVIPSRMQAARLPNKPLADIHGKPMVVHVLERAQRSASGDVVVACAEREVAQAVEKAGGVAVLTDPALPSGTDRVQAAWAQLDPKGDRYDVVVNVQGDLPTLDPQLLERTIQGLRLTPEASIMTPVTKITDMAELTTDSVVKVATGPWKTQGAHRLARAYYFCRSRIPHYSAECFHHVGLYAYRPQALNRFVQLPVSKLEGEEKLEQLRALEDDMKIYVTCVNTDTPFGVDTHQDLEKARRILG